VAAGSLGATTPGLSTMCLYSRKSSSCVPCFNDYNFSFAKSVLNKVPEPWVRLRSESSRHTTIVLTPLNAGERGKALHECPDALTCRCVRYVTVAVEHLPASDISTLPSNHGRIPSVRTTGSHAA